MHVNVFSITVGMIFVPCIFGAFSQDRSKTMPKENIFEFASSRNMVNGEYDDKRGFWDKRGYGDKRSIPESVLDEIDCEQFPWLCLVNLTGKSDEAQNTHAAVVFEKRGYGDKRGFWDKRKFGGKSETDTKHVGRYFPFMLMPDKA